jgi:hypothetical protein
VKESTRYANFRTNVWPIITHSSTWRHNPEDQHRHLHRRENLKLHTVKEGNSTRNLPTIHKAEEHHRALPNV